MANSIATGVAYQDPQLNLVAFTAYTVATAPLSAPLVKWLTSPMAQQEAPCWLSATAQTGCVATH